ncbi:MAG: 6,7-dimethyl-8-ribityllumazine synthase [Chlamydiae bacterium]|nr:6,7-dimethyl-8-ribityllumazine synthase [Chlamydiota bacterium]
MPNFEGDYQAKGHRYALVIARFNLPITKALLEGAIDALTRHGVSESDITTAWVPGSFELPLAAKKLAVSKKFDGVICLGAVIRGETPHFNFIAAQAASGTLQASLETGVPVIFSVLTTETKEQAEIRSGTKGGNKGFSDALAAIEMVNLLKQLS